MKIRERVTAAGTVTYQLGYYAQGVRKQRNFRTLAKAEAEMRRLMRLQRRHGEVGMTLDDTAVAEFVALRARCEAAGGSLLEAVEFFIRHGGAVARPLTLAAMADAFIASREALGKSRRYAQSLRSSLGALGRWLPVGRMAHEVTRAEVEQWLRSGGWASKSRRNHLGFAASCFAWGVREGCVRRNPCEGIEIAVTDEREIETLPLAVCERLLNASVKDAHAGLYVILGLMTGIRRAEAQRLTWGAVRLEEAMLVMEGEKTKTRRRRIIDLSECALAWLRAWVAHCGPVAAGHRVANANLHLHLAKLRKACGLTTLSQWPHNALRHTFASMHYAAFQDEARLQVMMGHESAAMLHRHYRAVKTRREAEAFWGLRPGEGLRLEA